MVFILLIFFTDFDIHTWFDFTELSMQTWNNCLFNFWFRTGPFCLIPIIPVTVLVDILPGTRCSSSSCYNLFLLKRLVFQWSNTFSNGRYQSPLYFSDPAFYNSHVDIAINPWGYTRDLYARIWTFFLNLIWYSTIFCLVFVWFVSFTTISDNDDVIL